MAGRVYVAHVPAHLVERLGLRRRLHVGEHFHQHSGRDFGPAIRGAGHVRIFHQGRAVHPRCVTDAARVIDFNIAIRRGQTHALASVGLEAEATLLRDKTQARGFGPQFDPAGTSGFQSGVFQIHQEELVSGRQALLYGLRQVLVLHDPEGLLMVQRTEFQGHGMARIGEGLLHVGLQLLSLQGRHHLRHEGAVAKLVLETRQGSAPAAPGEKNNGPGVPQLVEERFLSQG